MKLRPPESPVAAPRVPDGARDLGAAARVREREDLGGDIVGMGNSAARNQLIVIICVNLMPFWIAR